MVAPSEFSSRPTPPRTARPLLIVARDQRELCRTLQRAYRDTDEITILLDRRQVERRRARQPVARERRLGDRRRRPPITDELRLQHYVLVSLTGEDALPPQPASPGWRARVVRYLRNWCARRRATPTDPQPTSQHEEERSMPSDVAGPEWGRVLQWMEEAPTIFMNVRRMLHAYGQDTEAAQAAKAERDRLQQQCDALREEVQQLHADLARLRKERADMAHWLATMLQEAAARFPITPPPA